jgi:hypothetical protein
VAPCTQTEPRWPEIHVLIETRFDALILGANLSDHKENQGSLRCSLLPRHAWIKTRYAETPIGIPTADIHLPDYLRTVCLRNFHDL